MYGAGRILVGGTPVRAGTLLSRLGTEGKGRKSAVSTLLEHATPAGFGDPVAYLDRLIFDAAARASALEATLEFAESANRNPVLRCHVHVEPYGRHASVADTFYPFLRTSLAPRGTEPARVVPAR
jgi:hypothetical protein